MLQEDNKPKHIKELHSTLFSYLIQNTFSHAMVKRQRVSAHKPSSGSEAEGRNQLNSEKLHQPIKDQTRNRPHYHIDLR